MATWSCAGKVAGTIRAQGTEPTPAQPRMTQARLEKTQGLSQPRPSMSQRGLLDGHVLWSWTLIPRGLTHGRHAVLHHWELLASTLQLRSGFSCKALETLEAT